MKPSEIVRRALECFNSAERKHQENRWKDMAKYIVLEDTGNFQSTTSPGSNKMSTIYSSKAARAARDLTANIIGTLINPATKWVVPKFRSKKLNNDSEAIGWLEDSNDLVMANRAESAFYTEMAKFFLSLVSYANAVLLIEERKDGDKFKGIRYTNIHLSDVAWDVDDDGKAETLYIKLHLTPKQIMDKFGTLPLSLERLYEANSKDKVCVIQSIYEDPSLEDTDKEYTCSYILEQSGELIDEKQYYEFPGIVGRWEQLIGEDYGFSPGHMALPEIKSLNRLRELYLETEGLRAGSPLFVNQQNMIGPLSLAPRSINVVRDINGIKEFTPATRQSDSLQAIQELEMLIDKIFFLDKLMLPPRDQIGEMSAYETAQRIEQMQRVIGPNVSKIIHEILIPAVMREYKISMRNGLLPPLPQSLQKVDLDVEFVFLNQLARSQKMEDVSAIQGSIQDMMQMAQMNPNVMDVMNFDEAWKTMAQVRGVPESVIANPDEIKATREARAQQMQQQQQADLAVKQADVASKNAKANQSQGQPQQ